MLTGDQLTDDQAIEAADSLADELNKLCVGQPGFVVMMALAALIAHGMSDVLHEEGRSADELLGDHVKLVRSFLREEADDARGTN